MKTFVIQEKDDLSCIDYVLRTDRYTYDELQKIIDDLRATSTDFDADFENLLTDLEIDWDWEVRENILYF